MRDHRQVVVELFLELRKIADVVDSLIEPPGEFRRDRLRAAGMQAADIDTVLLLDRPSNLTDKRLP